MKKVVVVSDTHEQHDRVNVPEGDILVHAGDWTYKGSMQAIEKFLNWIGSQPHTYKVFIAGNHELGLDGPAREAKLELITTFCEKNPNMFYLENSGITVDGIKFYGSPVTPWFYDWAFNLPRGPEIAAKWALIPDNTNVLITHGPPYGMLDIVEEDGHYKHVGCRDLQDRIVQLKELKLSCFGHIHGAYGSISANNIVYVNGAMCDEDYRINRTPIVVEI